MLYIFNRIKKIPNPYHKNTNLVNLKETINITEENQELFDKKISQLYNTTPKEYLKTNLKWPTPVYKNDEVNPYEPVKLDNTYYYTKTDISAYKRLGISYSFNHNQNKYNETDIINKCYDIKYTKNNNTIYLETTSNFKCFDEYELLEKVTINLNTTCNVNIQNADKEENNKYTWYITKDDSDKQIKFEVECIDKKNKDTNDSSIIFTLIISYLILIGITIIIVKILQNKNNKI